ncbi:hypothetical protein F5Y10DRAFT_279912 [Nemania abortiva]|nr:hypothetical protein F5Y10DRAFT_279912 [Nemania abortiva]
MAVAPAVPASARQTIRAAFEELDRTITPADSRDFPDTTLQHVRKIALDIENQLAARQSLCHMSRLGPLFKGLEHYAKVIDVLCNGTPYLAWIWAPITLILRIASDYIEAFEQIIKGYSKIAESLKRFEVLSNAFSDNANFQQTLAVFYSDILQFHKHAYKLVRRSSWEVLFLTSWGRFQRRFNNLLEDMERHGKLVDKEAQAYHMSKMQQLQTHHTSELQQLRQDIHAWKEDSQEKVNRLEEEQAAQQYQSIVSWLKADESDQLAIFDFLSAEGSKYPGTCDWALKNKKIVSFLQQTQGTPILWLQGGPGSGKSVLSTQLVKFMKAAKMFVIYHFCLHSYSSSTTYEQVLRSMLIQLLRKDCDLVAHVYEECVLGKKTPTISALERLLHTLLISASQEPHRNEYIWVVIDGLEECVIQKQASVATLVNRITSKTRSSGRITCKVLISSRVSSALSGLRTNQVLSLTEEKDNIWLSIKHYTSQRLLSLRRKLNQLYMSPSEVDDIRDEITKKSDGMFLYARLVLDFLDNKIFYKSDEVKASVNELPRKLSDFYRKILTQVLVRLDPQSVDRISSIFSWIAFAKRPLKRIEFLSAISFSAGDSDVAHLAPTYILDVCGDLVEERRDNTLSFIHVSVKEFLQSSSSNLVIDEREAVAGHGIAVITCLLSGLNVFTKPYQNDNRYLRIIRGLHAFHIYSTEYWTEYLLSHVASTASQSPSILFNLAGQLAEKLHGLQGPLTEMQDSVDPALQDKRLAFLQHPLLRKEVERALWSRSLKGLESGLQTNTNLLSQDGISIMLASYEESVKFLLAQDDYPDVSIEELEVFKSQHRASVYTCRLTSCPRATLGFESEALRLDHEMTHLPQFRCSFLGCQNPPFVSRQAVRNHEKKYHASQPARKSIRRVSNNIATNSSMSTIEAPWGSPQRIAQALHNSIHQSKQIQIPKDTPPNEQDASIPSSIAKPEHYLEPTKIISRYASIIGLDRLVGKSRIISQSQAYVLSPSSIPTSTPTTSMTTSTIETRLELMSCVQAGGRPLRNPPPPPDWLETVLVCLQREESYANDKIDAIMNYCAVNTQTGMQCPFPQNGQQAPSYMKFYFVPGAFCLDCSHEFGSSSESPRTVVPVGSMRGSELITAFNGVGLTIKRILS